MTLQEWMTRWGHTQAAAELSEVLQPWQHVAPDPSDKSEAAFEADMTMMLSRKYRAPAWRNNSGALTDDKGRMIRFGLGNTSASLNARWKSPDRIGILPVVVQPHHVGRTHGLFLAIDAKKPGWTMRPSDKRAHAQAAFMNSVTSFGGVAGFAQSLDDIRRLVDESVS